MTKYSLIWWYMCGKMTKKQDIKCGLVGNQRNWSVAGRMKELAYKIGYWAA